MLKRTLLVVLVALFAIGCGKKEGAEKAKQKEPPKAEQKEGEKKAEEAKKGIADLLGKTEIDPVCEMKVKVEEDTPHSLHDGKHYFFCCDGCRKAFDNAPETFLK